MHFQDLKGDLSTPLNPRNSLFNSFPSKFLALFHLKGCNKIARSKGGVLSRYHLLETLDCIFFFPLSSYFYVFVLIKTQCGFLFIVILFSLIQLFGLLSILLVVQKKALFLMFAYALTPLARLGISICDF